MASCMWQCHVAPPVLGLKSFFQVVKGLLPQILCTMKFCDFFFLSWFFSSNLELMSLLGLEMYVHTELELHDNFCLYTSMNGITGIKQEPPPGADAPGLARSASYV